MKRLSLLSAIAILGFASCTKDDHQPERHDVKYNVTCTACTVIYTNAYGFPKTEPVTGHWLQSVPNFGVAVATLEISEEHPSNIVSSIAVNGVDHGNQLGPGKFSVTVK